MEVAQEGFWEPSSQAGVSLQLDQQERVLTCLLARAFPFM